MVTLIALTMQLIGSAFAGDAWLCTEASSQRRDNNFISCGIGEASEESTARAKALQNAQVEFKSLCDLSTDCKGHVMTVWPERTSCTHNSDGYVCHRMVRFTVGEELVKVEPVPAKEPDSTAQLTEIITKKLEELRQPTAAPKVVELPVAKVAPIVLAAAEETSDIECGVRCNATDQSACWLPGARWKLRHGCK